MPLAGLRKGMSAPGWARVRDGQVRLGFLETFSCKQREIGEKVGNFFTNLFLSALMSKKSVDL